MFLISAAGFFFGIDYINIDEEFLCCIICNGNAIGLVFLGAYSIQYGRWESYSESNISAIASNFIAAMAFIVAVVFVVIWLLYVTN